MKKTWIPLENGSEIQVPSRIVIHAMAEFIESDDTGYFAVDWIRKCNLSVHAFVTPSGVLIRSRQGRQGAWHAKHYNMNSLGIEFLVPGIHTYDTFIDTIRNPYLTAVQYQSGLEQVQAWVDEYGITEINRHSDLSPGRKEDPGTGFPWTDFLSDLS